MTDAPIKVQLEIDGALADMLARVKEVNPRLARDLRRDLRRSGDEIIAAQHAILDGPLPGNAEVVSTTSRLVVSRDGRATYRRKTYVFGDVATGRGGHRGMREGIKRSLSTRVSTSATRQGINIRASRRVGGVMVNTWQATHFRHKIFGKNVWMIQKGQPYFWGPVFAEWDNTRRKIEKALDDALAAID